MTAVLSKFAPFWIIRRLPVLLPPEAVTICGYADGLNKNRDDMSENFHLSASICINQYCVQDGPDVLPGVKDLDERAI
jgi:hypothetical protein